MTCPRCGHGAYLKTPDYGYGYGSEWACYVCDPYGRRFTSRELTGDQAKQADAESSASRATSSANAGLLLGGK